MFVVHTYTYALACARAARVGYLARERRVRATRRVVFSTQHTQHTTHKYATHTQSINIPRAHSAQHTLRVTSAHKHTNDPCALSSQLQSRLCAQGATVHAHPSPLHSTAHRSKPTKGQNAAVSLSNIKTRFLYQPLAVSALFAGSLRHTFAAAASSHTALRRGGRGAAAD